MAASWIDCDKPTICNTKLFQVNNLQLMDQTDSDVCTAISESSKKQIDRFTCLGFSYQAKFLCS